MRSMSEFPFLIDTSFVEVVLVPTLVLGIIEPLNLELFAPMKTIFVQKGDTAVQL